MPALTQTPLMDTFNSSYTNSTMEYTTPKPTLSLFEYFNLLVVLLSFTVISYMVFAKLSHVERRYYRMKGIEYIISPNFEPQADLDSKLSFKKTFKDENARTSALLAMDVQFDSLDAMIIQDITSGSQGVEDGIKSGKLSVTKYVSKHYEIRDESGRVVMAGGKETKEVGMDGRGFGIGGSAEDRRGCVPESEGKIFTII